MSVAHASISASEVAVRIQETGELEITTIVQDAARATLQLHGEMDLTNGDLLTAVLDNQLALGRRFVRLDLSRLEFLDSTGLQLIVHAHNKLLAARGTLVLTGLTPLIVRLLALTHLDQALFIADGPCGPPPARRQHLAAVAAR